MSINGEVIRYYKNGNVSHIDNYKNGKLHGECIIYYRNGEVMCILNYKNGKLQFNQKTKEEK